MPEASSEPMRVGAIVRNAAAGRELVRDASRRYGTSRIRLLWRCARLFGPRAFSLNEIRGLGLLDPRLAASELSRFTSKQRFLELLKNVNPSPYGILTEDKRVFSAMCRASDLPVPTEFGYVHRGVAVLPGETGPCEHHDLAAVIRDRLPERFVVKAAGGVYGRGIEFPERDGDSVRAADGGVLGVDEFARRLAARSFDDCQLLQARLRNHEDIRALGGAGGLDCTRFTTFVDDRGSPRLLFYMHKLATGTNPTDNFAFGRSGNLIAIGDETGRLTEAIGAAPGGAGLVRTERHPDSGLPVRGFVLPFWEEARDLVLRAARAFLPLRTLGWDVALTDGGPVIVEANAWWDPVNYAPELVSAGDMNCLRRAGAG